MAETNLNRLINTGIALSSERDNDKLLSFILSGTMSVTNADCGVLYLYDDDKLCFKFMINQTMQICQNSSEYRNSNGNSKLLESNICAHCAINNVIVNIHDIKDIKEFDFSSTLKYGDDTGYNTKSMLVVPLANNNGNVVGVLQLINAKDNNGNDAVFEKSMENYVLSMASQAAVSVTNIQNLKEIKDLMRSLVYVLSAAIDEITPYNANHTKNMVAYCEKLIEYINFKYNKCEFLEYFDKNRKEQLIMSIWLHDIGKLVIPLEVMNKATRLAEKLVSIKERFKIIALQNKINLLENKIDEKEYKIISRAIENVVDFVVKTDGCIFLTDRDLEELRIISKYTYKDLDGSEKSWLTNDEIMELSVRRGTLTDGERRVMETHVIITSKLLEKIKFNREYKNVPLWAGSHHEFLDGTGYPKGLVDKDIPFEVRIITTLDVFEALTAKDRPYRQGMTPDKAIKVLEGMAQEGKLDLSLVQIVRESKMWL